MGNQIRANSLASLMRVTLFFLDFCLRSVALLQLNKVDSNYNVLCFKFANILYSIKFLLTRQAEVKYNQYYEEARI